MTIFFGETHLFHSPCFLHRHCVIFHKIWDGVGSMHLALIGVEHGDLAVPLRNLN